MKIALIGATGMIGSRILTEALERGHDVIAIVRKPETVPVHPRVKAVAGDATDPESVAAVAAGADVAVSAYSPQTGPPDNLSKNALALMAGLPRAGVPRVIVVGGAGSLEVAPGVLLEETPDFPAAYKVRAHAQKEMLDVFRSLTDPPVTWSFLSPPIQIAPGERTGKYRLGGDRLLDPPRSISAEDYAIAILDEIENPKHPNRRFTVASE